ncbi:hypothetical protein DFH09DRAFT_1139931 [Mycena vulgaris]|nr:hypothetical protein DFH09DRAFT_1139931 [Mycena vulgaris]
MSGTQPLGDPFSSTARGAGGTSLTHTSTHTSTTGLSSTGLPTNNSGGKSSILSSPGAISGLVLGALALLSILGAITRRLKRQNAAPIIMHVEPTPPPPPPTLPHSMSSASNTINIYGLNPAPVHSNSGSPGYNYASAPPSPYSPVAFAPPAPNIHQNTQLNQSINQNASYRPATSWAAPAQPAPFNHHINPHTPYPPAAGPPQGASYNPPTSTPEPPHASTNHAETKYYGVGDYAISWDVPAPAHGSSARLPPNPSSQEVEAGPINHANTLPPSYNEQWR